MKALNDIFSLLKTEYAPNLCKCLAFIMTLSLLIQASGFAFWIVYFKPLYYVATIICFLYVLSDRFTCDKFILFFLLILGLNAFFMPIDSVFNSEFRFCFFTLVMFVSSPLIINSKAILFRQCVFKYLLIGHVFLVLGSFICFFLGINLMPYNRLVQGDVMTDYLDDYQSRGGWFSGLYAHSMVLGPCSVIVAFLFLITYINNQSKINLFLFLVSSATTIISASRAAVLALVIPIVYFFSFSTAFINARKSICTLVCVGGLLLIPISDSIFSGIANKQRDRIEENEGNLNSRSEKMQCRIDEFLTSPILGIGFASVDRTLDVVSVDGGIEPGSSHLAVLSMTGLVGFISYCLVLLRGYRLIRNRIHPRSFFLIALFWAFFSHLWFEGYIFGAGNSICFMFWLVISQCFDYKYLEDNENSILYKYAE